MKIPVLLIVLLIFAQNVVAETVPKDLAFIIGEWEATEASNRYRMNVIWNKETKELYGYLTKNGAASARVGFAVGEHVFTAKIIKKPSMVVAVQKYRQGVNGSSTWSAWVTATLDITASSKSRLVANYPTYLGGSNTKSTYTKIN